MAAKKEYAYLLYMKGLKQKDICASAEITPATLIKWRDEGGWAENRTASAVSVDGLIIRVLQKADEMLNEKDFNSDAFSKAIATLRGLKKGATPDEKINAFMAFGDWLITQAASDEDLTTDFIRKVTRYQDMYVMNILKDGRR